MMPLRRFAIHRPADLGEAAEMLEHYGENGSLYAGGTELLLAMRHDLLRYENLIDIKAVAGLDGIERGDSQLHIGAAATHRMIERSAVVRESLPVMAEMAAHVANVRVRATGTLGGISASPSPTPIPPPCCWPWAAAPARRENRANGRCPWKNFSPAPTRTPSPRTRF